MDIIPQRIGVKCKQPAITLIYEMGSKTRVRIMPVRFLNKYGASVIDTVAEELKNNHKAYLENVPNQKLKKMLRILQETQKGTDIEKASKIISNEFSINPNEDLNKLSDSELAQKKKIMEDNFLRNRVKEGDPLFQYDIQVDFDSKEKIKADWDSDQDDVDFYA